MRDPSRKKMPVGEGEGGALQALPTPALPPRVTVGDSTAPPADRMGAGLGGARHSQAAGATSLHLALALMTVQLQLRSFSAIGHTG